MLGQVKRLDRPLPPGEGRGEGLVKGIRLRSIGRIILCVILREAGWVGVKRRIKRDAKEHFVHVRVVAIDRGQNGAH